MIETALEAIWRTGEGVGVRKGVIVAGPGGGETVGGFGGSGSAGPFEGGEAAEMLDSAVHGCGGLLLVVMDGVE